MSKCELRHNFPGVFSLVETGNGFNPNGVVDTSDFYLLADVAADAAHELVRNHCFGCDSRQGCNPLASQTGRFIHRPMIESALPIADLK